MSEVDGVGELITDEKVEEIFGSLMKFLEVGLFDFIFAFDLFDD